MLTKRIQEFLISNGFLKEDLAQIEECFHKCKYKIAKMPKLYGDMSTDDFDKLKYERCSRQQALDTLGWQEFWLGIGRTAFHASTTRQKGRMTVSFSWKYWRE